jgi:hypothetical protein
MSGRSPEEIRQSIETNRTELVGAVGRLRAEVTVAADWRRHIRRHQREVLIGAAVAGFVLGGGLAVFGRRRR